MYNNILIIHYDVTVVQIPLENQNCLSPLRYFLLFLGFGGFFSEGGGVALCLATQLTIF